MLMLRTSIGRLRAIGLAEAVSFLLLLGIAMPLKYFAGEPEAVRVVGMAHGVLFLAYLLAIVHAHVEYNWNLRRSSLVFLAALLPFGPFVADSKVLRALPQ